MENLSKIYISEKFDKSLNTSDILYAESDINYTRFHLTNGKVIISSYTLGRYLNRLIINGFYQIHRGICVNAKYFEGFDLPQKPNFLYLKGGKEFTIARRRRDETLKYFGLFT